MNDAELDAMLSEIGGPCNFENMLRCFTADGRPLSRARDDWDTSVPELILWGKWGAHYGPS